MFRQTTTDEVIPYSKKQTIPGRIDLSDYDLGKNNFAYYDTSVSDNRENGEFSAWNAGWRYRNDGVDIEENNEDDNKDDNEETEKRSNLVQTNADVNKINNELYELYKNNKTELKIDEIKSYAPTTYKAIFDVYKRFD